MDASKLTPQKNDTFRCVIHGYTHDGLGVARVDERAVFIPGGARGDEGLARFTKVTSSVAYARIERLETPSPHRTDPDCPAYPRCGGCAFRHITYEEEWRAKLERAEETIRRVSGVALSAEEGFPAPTADGTRGKAAFPVGRDGAGHIVTGFYRGRTHEIVPADTCRLQSPAANAAAAALRDALDGSDGLGIRHLLVRDGTDGSLACLISTQKPGTAAWELAETLKTRVPSLRGIVWRRHSGQGNAVVSGKETRLWGQDFIEDELRLAPGEPPLRFRLSSGSFWQVNKPQAERMYRRALAYAGDFTSALDLYCGAGSLTQMAARSRPGARVTGVEIVPEAVRDASESARRNGLDNVEFLQADAGEAVRRFDGPERPDVVFLDPPRKGISPETAEAVLRLSPRRIVYLSCDPATLARDIRRFSEGGYTAQRLTVADFFPRTAHVESLVLLTRDIIL